MAEQKIGRYTILKRLGGGGFGEVFLGEDPTIGRQVAIKVFKPKDENLIAFATSSDEEGLEILRARFLSEAKILASLHNARYVVEVLDYGETEDGAPYYIMPYLPHSLADELGRDVFDVKALEELPEDQRPRAMPMERALALLEQVLAGLAAAHGRGLIHRDLKPSNIMLTEDDDVRIVDFGIAKAPDGQHSTVSHLGLGSRNYMAPEQRESAKHVDARADIYAVGRLAYRMLTGKLPVGRFADPAIAVPTLGKAMNDVILAALEEDRERRPADASELLARFSEARKSVGQDDAGEATGTWVGQGEAAVRDELKPLRAKIAELVAAFGAVRAKDRPGINALASIAELNDTDLDRLIADVIQSDKTLAAKSRLFSALHREVRAKGGALDEGELASYDTAADSVGWDREKIQELIRQAVAELDSSDQASPKSERSRKSVPSDGSRALPLKPIGIAAGILLVVLAGGWGVMEWRQAQLIAEQQEQQRAAEAEAERVAWAEAESANTVERYQTYLDQWPSGLNRTEATQRIAALEEQGQSLVGQIQDYLNRLGYRVPENGDLETRTVESIKAFEEEQDLVVTGNADEVLLESLQEEFRERDEVAWAAATDTDTEEAYSSYRDQFPEGQYASQVDNRIFDIRDGLAWQAAREQNTEAGYRGYAEAFPQGAFVEEVDGRIAAVQAAAAQAQRQRELAEQRAADDAAWTRAQDDRTQVGYRRYLEQWPDGQHRDRAQSAIDELIAEAIALEDRRWAQARNQDNSRAYQSYIDDYPEGRHLAAAQTALEASLAREALISKIQSEIARLGPEVEANGQLDDRTLWAIQNFQRLTGLEPSGEPSETLLAQMKNASDWPAPKPGGTFSDCSDCPEMVVIPAGEFTMGSRSREPQRQDNEGPQHSVTLPAFALARTEVTFDQWNACVAAGGCSHRPDDEGWGRGDQPAINVSWNNAREYVSWLSEKTGEEYRLPSEAEWEYAARARTTTRFNSGDCITTDQANFDGNYPAEGCAKGQYRERTVPAGSFSPNDFGLHGMHGNVWEWVQDCWNDSYRGAPGDGSAWMTGDCGRAVLRGGSWGSDGRLLRSAFRTRNFRGVGGYYTGFRPARSVAL